MKKSIIALKIILALLMLPQALHAQWQNGFPYNNTESIDVTGYDLDPSLFEEGTNQEQVEAAGMGITMTNVYSDGDYTNADYITQDIKAAARAFGTKAEANKYSTDVAYRILKWFKYNIEYVPYGGARRGAHVTWLERTGNDFDICALYAAMLRAAGYENVEYCFGNVYMTEAEVIALLGAVGYNNWTSSVSTAGSQYLQILEHAGVKYLSPYTTGTENGKIRMPHVWVRVTIQGIPYDLDPSFKPKNPNAMKYRFPWEGIFGKAVQFGGTLTGKKFAMTLAEIASVGGKLTAASVAKDDALRQDGVRELTGPQMAGFTKLLPEEARAHWSDTWWWYYDTEPDWLKMNFETSDVQTWPHIPKDYSLKMIIVGQGLREATPMQPVMPWDPVFGAWEIYMPDLRGGNLNYSFAYDSNTMDFTIKLTSSGNNNAAIDESMILLPPIAKQPLPKPYGDPYYASRLVIAYESHVMREGETPRVPMMTETKAFVGIIKWNATISYGFGETQGRLSYYLRNYRAAVSDRTIDKNIVGLQHQVDYEILLRLLGRSTDCIVSNLLHTGIITDAYGEAPTVDFPLNMMLCWPLVASDAQAAANKAERVFFAASCIISSMERACLEQAIYPENAVSTMRLLKKALEQQVPIHMVESIAEYDTLVASLSIPSAADTEIRTTLTGGGRVIFPESFDLSAGNYVGAGYVLMEAGTDGTIEKISMKISGGLSGGSAEKPVGINTKRPNLQAAADVVPKARSKIPPHMADSKGSTLGDPIDATTGSFITSSTELVLGSGAAPTGLSFTRYLGRVSGDPVGLGSGWTHNYDIRLVFRSPNDINWRNAGVSEFVPLQMGASALGDIVLEGDSSFPPVFPPVANDRMNIRSCVVAALIADWVGEQLVQKRACVVMGNNSFEFVKRPDDSFAPPPAIAATLKKDETDGTYTLEFYKGLQIKFDSTTGKFTHIIDPNTASQNTLTAEYVNGDLWKVTDCYGRHLIFEKQSNGKLGSVTDSTGRSANLVNFNVSYWTDPMGYGNQRMYDIGITDANGNEVFGINTISQISGMFNSFSDASRCGVLFQAMMDDPNRVWEIGICDGMARQTDPNGKTKWLYFDCFGQLRATEHEDGSTTSAFYDGENRLVSAGSGVIVIDSDDWRQWRKMAFWKYDAYNRVTEIARPTIIQGFDSSGPKTTITYEDYVSGTQPGKIQITDAVNNQTVITVGNYNKPVAVETTGLGKSEYEYDARGRLVKLHPAFYAPDKWINYDYVEETGYGIKKITATYPDGTTEASYLDNCGDVVQFLDRNKKRVTANYDLNRKLMAVHRWPGTYDGAEPQADEAPSAGALSTCFTYDPVGDLVEIQDPSGAKVQYSFDPLGNLLTVKDDNGNTRLTNEYSPTDNPIKSTGILGERVTREFDAMGRVTGITDPLGRTTLLTYNYDGLLSAINTPENNTTAYIYDTEGRPTTIQDPLNGTIKSGYDGIGRQIGLENRLANIYKTVYTSGTTGMTVTGTTPMLTRSEIKTDTRGLVTEVLQPSGHVIKIVEHDDEGRAVKQEVHAPDDGGVIATRIYYYLPNGLVTSVSETMNGITRQSSYTYDDFYRLSSYHGGEGTVADSTLYYEYDNAGNLTKLTYPGGDSVSYTYDNLQRLTEVKDWADRETFYEYDIADRLVEIRRPNGTVRRHIFDNAGQLRMIEEWDASDELIWLRALKYDLDGNVIETITSPNLTDQTWQMPESTMTYDADNRIAVWNGNTVDHDANGNMTFGPLPDGNMSTYTYDAYDRLASAGGVQSRYNPEGLRVEADGAAYVVNPNSGLSQVLVREKGATTTRYVWGLGLIYEDEGGEIKTYHSDQLGSTVAMADGTGVVTDRWEYTSYGTVSYQGTADTPFLFHGGLGCMTDSNGLVYMRARFYNPRIMRFLNADPIGFDGGMNWYAAFGNNPLSFVDPLGLCADDGSSSNATIPQLNSRLDSLYAARKSWVSARGTSIYNMPMESPYDAEIGEVHGMISHIRSTVRWTNAMFGMADAYRTVSGQDALGYHVNADGIDVTDSRWAGMFNNVGLVKSRLSIIAAETGMLGTITPPTTVATIDPALVRFSQSSIKSTFSQGGTLSDLAAALRSGAVKAESVPAIRLVLRDGKLFTLDNRRLWAFQQANVRVPYRMATPKEAAAEAWKFTTKNDGISIYLRGSQ